MCVCVCERVHFCGHVRARDRGHTLYSVNRVWMCGQSVCSGLDMYVHLCSLREGHVLHVCTFLPVGVSLRIFWVCLFVCLAYIDR